MPRVGSLAGGRLARAALLIAAITALARVVGFGRTVTFGHAVGTGCVATAYQTANTVPNIVFDIVAGGALAALVVPVLAPLFAGADHAQASRAVSALLSWAMLILVPAAVLIALLARPLTELLLGPHDCAGAADVGSRMIVVFAPQVVFYGVAVVVGGALQAGERFTWPALAPLLSSLVVIGAYLWFGAAVGPGRDVAGLPRGDELVLSLGTTVGVVVLAACQLPALRRAGIRVRPTLRFPTGIAPTARRAAVAGVLTLGAMQLSSAVMIRLANDGTEKGTVVIVALAQTVFLLPWAVLSVPVATSAFPRLSAAWDAGDAPGARRLTGTALKAVLALSAVGTAALVAAAEPTTNLLLGPTASAREALAPTIAAFAVGLIGWSLVALLARVLYAGGRTSVAARAQVIGQVSVIVADVVLAVTVAERWRGVVLGLGNAAGVGVAVALLLVAARRAGVIGPLRAVTADLARAAAAAVAGALAGWLLGRTARGDGALLSLLLATGAALLAGAVAAGVLLAVDRGMLAAVRSRSGRTS